MKKLSVLILVLILAFAAMGAMAEECAHQFDPLNGKCVKCGAECEHEWDSSSSQCTKCYMVCSHSEIEQQALQSETVETYQSKSEQEHRIMNEAHAFRECPTCHYKQIDYSNPPQLSDTGKSAPHQFVDGVCTLCYMQCSHVNLSSGKTVVQTEGPKLADLDGQNHITATLSVTYQTCPTCSKNVPIKQEIISQSGTPEEHDWDSNGNCRSCGYQCKQHDFEDGVCKLCNYKCSHLTNPSCFNSNTGKCDMCGFECLHENKTPQGQPTVEYEWLSNQKHLARTTRQMRCSTCGFSMPTIAQVVETEEPHTLDGNGNCSVCQYPIEGGKPEYEYNQMTNTLTITGVGSIENYTSGDATPWKDYRTVASRIVLEKNVAGIGANAFAGFTNPNLRVEFLQTNKPTIAATAFSGTTATCRYYADNDTWKNSSDGLKWVYLPYFDAQDMNSHCIIYDGNWYITPQAMGGAYYNLYITPTQAIEYARGGNEGRKVTLQAMPSADDPVILDGWDKVNEISFQNGFEGTMTIDLGATAVLRRIEFSAPKATVTVNAQNLPDDYTYRSIRAVAGTLIYNGNISDLMLTCNNTSSNDVGSITINGDIGNLNHYSLTSNMPYRGSLTVNGTVAKGSILGAQTLNIPGIGDIQISGTSGQTFEQLVRQDEPIIKDSKLNLSAENAKKLSGSSISLDDYRLTYQFMDNRVGMTLYPKAGGGMTLTVENIYDVNPNFTTDDIIYGTDTSVNVGLWKGPNLVFNGAGGLNEILLEDAGKVELNCPVVQRVRVNQPYYSEGGTDLVINSAVHECSLTVDNITNPSTVKLGANGSIEKGNWVRQLRATRVFSDVSGACDVFTGGTLSVMSKKENDNIYVGFPSDATVAAAAGVNNASVEMVDAALDGTENTVVEEYLKGSQNITGEVKAVVDVSVNQYSVGANGEFSLGANISQLNKPIPLTVENTTGGFAYVLRLHGSEAEQMNEASAQEMLEFESDKFSKYVIVKAGAINHEHQFSYSVSGDTITVTCANKDGCSMPNNQVTLKIIKPELKTEGDAASEKATLEGYEDFNAALGWNTDETTDQAISDADIVYTSSDGLTTYPEAPTTAGSYTAKLTVYVGEQEPLTIKADYDIKKNTPDYNLPTGLTGVYGDKLSTVPLPTNDPAGTWAWANDATVISGIGEQTFAAVFSAEGYDQLTVEVTVTVSPKSVTITGLSASNKTYDGTNKATPIGDAWIEGKLDGDDLTVKAGTAAFADANAGTGKTVTFTGYELDGTAKDNYELSGQPASVKADITAKSIEGATVTLDNEKIEHTGSELSVAVQSVVLDGQPLSAETDYKVSGNTVGTDKGDYTVTVTGKGNYTGTATAMWKITDALMEVTAKDVSAIYDGKDHGIEVTVKGKKSQAIIESATINYGTTVGTYDKTVSPTVREVKNSPLTVYYQITATGYETETGYATVTITPKEVAAPTITVAEGTYVYNNGEKIQPTVTVKDGETAIPANEYTVSYSNNTNAGTATLTITDVDGGNYTITEATQSFTIAPKEVAAPTITVADGTSVYNNGEEIQPDVTVKDGETVIPANEYTVSYSNNTNAGTATVTITDNVGGNYTVSGTTSFTIDRAANPAQVATTATVVMGGNQLDLADNVTGGIGAVTYAISGETNDCALEGSRLTSGNTTGSVTVTVTVAGNDNYKPLTATITVTVDPKSIAGADVALSAQSVGYTGNAQNVTVTSVTLDSVTLSADTDYEVAESSALSGTNVGTYTVTVTGKGNYTGVATATWQITKAASGITTDPAAVENLTYTGEAQELVTAGTPNGGTMNYAVTMENAQPAETEFKADLPKKTDTGTYYVWFMVKGDDNHEDTAVASSPVTVAIGEVDKTELTTAIGDAETYYNTIKDNADYTVIAATLKSAIDAAQAVANNPNVTAAQVSNAKKSVADAEEAAKADKQAADEKKAADEAAAKAVTDAIDALPGNAGASDKTAVSEARKAYEALSADQKKLVSGDELKKLTDAEDSVKAAEKKIADEAAAKAVTDAFDALPDNAGVNDKTAVSEARKAYEALSADQKKLVSGDELKKLTNAEASVQAAEEAAKKAAEEAARKAAEEEAARKAAEEAARKAAEEEAAKKAAEEEAARKAAEEAAAKQAADEAAAKSVEDAIRALSDSAGTGDKGAVEEARRAYDALTEDQKKLVPGDALSKLTAAEQQVAAAEEAAKTVKISDCKITVKSLAYTGKKIKKPTVTVMYDGQKLKEGTDYSFTYNKKAKAIGAYIVTVKGKGRFTGSKKVTLKVVPKGTAFSKVTGGSKQVTLKWKSQKNITGYQIEYSLKKDFSASKKVTVKKAKTLSTTIRKLKASTKYYVRIRTYTTVKKKNYYSAWSKAKTVKTKAGRAGNESVEPEIEIGIDVGDMSLEIDEISIDEIILDDGGTIDDGEIIVDEVVEVPVE